MHWALIVYAITFIVLFANFYYRTYKEPKGSARSGKPVQNGKAITNGGAYANGVVHKVDNHKSGVETGRKKRKGKSKRE